MPHNQSVLSALGHLPPILKLFLLVVIALIPAILLYWLFGDLNVSEVEWMNKTVTLGGPVAAFFAVLLFLERTNRGMEARLHDDTTSYLALLAPLEGTWSVASFSSQSEARATSTTRMCVDDGLLTLTGGIFNREASDGKPAKIMGDWTCDMAVCSGHRLVYLYGLTDRSTAHSFWRGIVDVRRVSESDPIEFQGTWQVFGPESHGGAITLTKQPE